MKKERKSLYILLSLLLVSLLASLILMLKMEKSPDIHRFQYIGQHLPQMDMEEAVAKSLQLLKHNELNQAEILLLDTVSKNPKASEPRILLGSTYYRQGRYTLAEQTFQQLLLYHPASAAGYNNLCETQIKLKKLAEAKKSIARAIDLDPENRNFLLKAANLHAMLREDAQAIDYLRKAFLLGETTENILNYRELMLLMERPAFQQYYNQTTSDLPAQKQ